MKYIILMYGSQHDYDGMAGNAGAGEPTWSAAEFAAMGEFMESFGKDLAESGELVDAQGLTAPVHPASGWPCPPTPRSRTPTTRSSCCSCAAIPRCRPPRRSR